MLQAAGSVATAMREWEACAALSGLRRWLCYTVLVLPPLSVEESLGAFGTATITINALECTSIRFGGLSSAANASSLTLSVSAATLSCRTDELSIAGDIGCKKAPCSGTAGISSTAGTTGATTSTDWKTIVSRGHTETI